MKNLSTTHIIKELVVTDLLSTILLLMRNLITNFVKNREDELGRQVKIIYQ